MTKYFLLLLTSITLLTGCGGGSRELAALGNVPAGFEALNLSVSQAEDLNAWLEANQPTPDPADLAQYLESILRRDQRAAFDQLIQSGGPANPGVQ